MTSRMKMKKKTRTMMEKGSLTKMTSKCTNSSLQISNKINNNSMRARCLLLLNKMSKRKKKKMTT